MILLKVPDNLQGVYQAIGRKSVGYCRTTTNTPDINGGNRNASAWAKSLGIGKSTFLRKIAKLEELGFIKVHAGSQFMLNGGSYPNYYSIRFNTELQKKHSIYFDSSREDKQTKPMKIEEVVDTYYTDNYLLYNNDVMYKNTPDLAEMKVQSFRDNIRVPTTNELTEYLNKQLDTKFIVLEGNRDDRQ